MEYIVTTKEMQCADENTIRFFGVPQLVLMERAALSAGDVIVQRWPELFVGGARILIAIGNGNNGGDGAALARLFYLQGHRVTALVGGDWAKYSPALKTQMAILEKYRGETLKTPSVRGGISIVTNVERRQESGEICGEDGCLQKKRRFWEDYDLVIDALFGIGLSRPVEGGYREKIEWLNSLSGKKVSLDIPSGISAEDGRIQGVSFRADLTVTFGFLKTGMLLYPGKNFCGEVRTADIGITEESFLGNFPAGITLAKGAGEDQSGRTGKRAESLWPHRTPDSHKGSYGKVLLFAGSIDAPGAALLAGEAALRSGAGMLQLVSPVENRELVLTKLPEAMYRTFDEDTEWARLLDWCDAVVLGPGIGQEKTVSDSLGKILTLMSEKEARKPIVLDADGLNLTASSEKLTRLVKEYTAGGGIVIMTPHMAELSRLLHCSVEELQAGRMEEAARYAKESGAILVSKDAATVVCYVNEAGNFHYYVNQTGNNGMATAGSGDVLSGIAGAFAAFTAVRLRKAAADGDGAGGGFRRAAYFEAAYRAVHLHGLAGDRAAEKYGETAMKAGDIISALPELFREREAAGRKGHGQKQDTGYA